MDYKKYQVTILPTVLKQISNTIDYIKTNFSEEYAKNRANLIFKSLEELAIFPERGFNADDKFQNKIDSRYTTRGITIQKDYIALYFIDDMREEVVVTHLLPARSDHIKLFK
ncbi:UNVERIFIED_CONTAM: type II toxin-antitoxin system RelE/ParE family toxin [Streptococcus canis]